MPFIRKTHAQFIKDANKVKRPSVRILGRYAGALTKIKVECTLCGAIRYPKAHSILSGHGCKSCMIKEKRPRKTHDQFVVDLKIAQSDVEVLGKYLGSLHRIECRCLICKNIWSPKASSLLDGHRCPNCWNKHSKLEDKIAEVLNIAGISYKKYAQFSGCRLQLPLSFDFHLTDRKILIEADGKQHFVPVHFWGGLKNFKAIRKRDRIKTKWARENGYSLIRVPYNRQNDIVGFLQKQGVLNG
jgi:hypothetical protein